MLCKRLIIRKSTSKDQRAIRKVETEAFGRTAEANLVEQLISAVEHTISMVAVCDGEIVGHVLLTEIEAPVKAMALAPLAVIPRYREMQVGTELVQTGVAAAKRENFKAVFALGDVLYYERFGFSSKLADSFKVDWQGKHFMALELVAGALKGKSGRLVYPEPFFRV